MLQTEMLRYWTVQAVMLCNDLDLLDLLLKLLTLGGGVDHATP